MQVSTIIGSLEDLRVWSEKEGRQGERGSGTRGLSSTGAKLFAEREASVTMLTQNMILRAM